MASSKQLSKLVIFPLLIVVSLVAGLIIPAFYDWTGSEQSRPSPLINQTAVGLILCGLIVCLALPWLPISDDSPAIRPGARLQFKIRTAMVMMAAVAAVIVALREIPMVVGVAAYGIACCYVVRFWILFRPYRWQTLALGACMYLPFAWIVPYDELANLLPAILWMASGLPAFFPTMLVGSVVRQQHQELMWLPTLVTSLELVTGVWMIRLGPRRAIAYCLFALISSIFGSFVLNALVRM